MTYVQQQNILQSSFVVRRPLTPREAGVPPFLSFFLPCQFTPSSFVLFTFSLFPFLIRFNYFLLLFFPFYQKSHHTISWPEIVGGDRTWVYSLFRFSCVICIA